MKIFGEYNILQDKTVLVYDDGYSVSLAEELSKTFKKSIKRLKGERSPLNIPEAPTLPLRKALV